MILFDVVTSCFKVVSNRRRVITFRKSLEMNLNKTKRFCCWTFLLNAAQTTLLSHPYTWRRPSLDSIPNGIHLHHTNTKSASSALNKNKNKNKPNEPIATVPRKDIIVLLYLGLHSNQIAKRLKPCVHPFYSFVNVKVIFQNTRRIKSFPCKDRLNRSQLSRAIYKASC